MGFNIVLIEPEIPTNTGNIGRLAMASGSRLHLVKPFGFEIDDNRLKRAGLDYWQHLDPVIYESKEEFFEKNAHASMYFFSSHGEKDFWEAEYDVDAFLIFGKESVGLDKNILENNRDRVYRIPLFSEKVRSLNLANAVGIVTYEGIRQARLKTVH